MMKKSILTILAFACTLCMSAESIDGAAALLKAQQFMPGKQFSEVKTASKARSEGQSGNEPFYIFNAEKDGGFVIVSGDDRTEVILGYAEQGQVAEDNMPENLRYWLACYAEQIRRLGDSNVSHARGTRSSDSKAAVRPLITTKWNQGAPFNLMCPDGTGKDYNDSDYNPDNVCLTGCVATAMAQMMYYHKCPAGPTATIPEYTTSSGKFSLAALPPTTFDWANMRAEYDSEATDASEKAVATLMRYCGQAVNMDYGLYFSGAAVSPYIMGTYFGYGKNARQLSRNLYSSSAWDDLIYKELSEGRPVLYSGSSASGGHQFICDGYDGNGLFHFNWGWGGMSDGYFLLSVANPSDLGLGGGTSEDGYSAYQQAIIGLKPDNGEAEKPYVRSFIFDPEDWVTTYSRSSASEDFTGVSLPGLIIMNYTYYAEGETWPDYELTCGWGLYQDGVLKTVLGASDHKLTDSENLTPNDPSVSFGSGLADGVYMLSQVYRPKGSEAWLPCDTWSLSFISATVSGNTLTLRKAAEDDYSTNVTINSVEYSISSFEVGKPVEVTVNLTNKGDAFQELVFFWYGSDSDKDWTVVCGSIEPGKTGTVKLHFTPKESGRIPFKITTDGPDSEVLWSETVTIETPKEQVLTATATTPGLVDRVLTGTTLKVNVNVTNEGSNVYENVIQLDLFENTKDPSSPYYGGPLVTTKSVMSTIQPGETKEVDFVIEDLNLDKRYFFFLGYKSAGEYTSLDISGVGYPFSLEAEAETPLLGDADGNGKLDSADVSAVARYIMEGDYEGFVFELADANEDGKVDVADIVRIVQLIKEKAE